MATRELYAAVLSYPHSDLAEDLLSGDTRIEDVFGTKQDARVYAEAANKSIKPNGEYRVVKVTIEPR